MHFPLPTRLGSQNKIQPAKGNTMHIKFFLIASCLLISSGCDWVKGPSPYALKGWSRYKNISYGYEIYYPDKYDLWPTGPEGRRDGFSIRIAYKDYEAPVPVLDIQISPKVTRDEFEVSYGQLDDMDLTSSRRQIDSREGIQKEYRWKSNGETSLVAIYLDGMVFNFMAGSGIANFQETEWWMIVSSFRKI